MANMETPRRPLSDTMPAVLAAAFGGNMLHHDLQGVVARALRSARATGRDYLGQTEAAARAVVAVRPDLTLSQAMVAVNWLRDHDA
jgi:hypothetical protein